MLRNTVPCIRDTDSGARVPIYLRGALSQSAVADRILPMGTLRFSSLAVADTVVLSSIPSSTKTEWVAAAAPPLLRAPDALDGAPRPRWYAAKAARIVL